MDETIAIVTIFITEPSMSSTAHGQESRNMFMRMRLFGGADSVSDTNSDSGTGAVTPSGIICGDSALFIY